MANKTVYPYGTDGSLPSSVGIINDLITGGADNALSAEMGKVLGNAVGNPAEEKQLVATKTYQSVSIDQTTGAIASVSSNNAIVCEYTLPVNTEELLVSGRRGATSGMCMLAYFNGDTFLGYELPNTGDAIDVDNYQATVPAGTTMFRVAGNSVHQQPAAYVDIVATGLYEDIAEIEEEIAGIEAKTEINILVIGNSYSYDSFSYVPYIVRQNLPNVKLNMAILYQGGCSLQEHLANLNNDTPYAGYAHYYSNENKWTVASNSVSMEDALGMKNWDIITFQQNSANSRDYSTYSYLGDLIGGIYGIIDYPIKIGWVMTPAWADGYSSLVGTSAQMYADIVDCVENLIKDYPVEVVFPYGTAIQNARGTSLDSLGTFGHLTYDGTHLAEGIPCLVAAYANFLEIVKQSGNDYRSIFGEQTRTNSTWISGQNIPGQHGSPVGVTDANCLIAQKCAIMASKFPMEVSTIR